MKTRTKRLCYLIILLLLPTTLVFGQTEYYRAINSYFRVDPYEGSFSGFVEALSSDTALHFKQELKQTDTTGYLLKGHYDLFNPFSINAVQVDMVFYERERDTGKGIKERIFAYQLTAFFEDNPYNRKKVKKDYAKMQRVFDRNMNSNPQSLKGYQGLEDGALNNFHFTNYIQPSVVISWQTMKGSSQPRLALSIVAYLAQVQNRAYPAGHGAW
ncbi:hypothetical protein [Niabella terrae]